MEDKRYLKLHNYFGYALGGFGQCFVLIFANFILLFMTDTIGMNVGIVGTLMMVSKVFDGISDIRHIQKWEKQDPGFSGLLFLWELLNYYCFLFHKKKALCSMRTSLLLIAC